MHHLLPFAPALPRLNLTGLIDILVVAFLVYQALMVVRGTRAFHVLTGLIIVVALYALATWAGLEGLRSLLALIVPYIGLAVIVLFQSEIRRALARLGRKRWFGLGGGRAPESVNEILLAVERLSSSKTGALIVLERDIGLRTFIESGVGLDAAISRDLICSIFMPGTALHDGAIIIQKDRIAAAACFLPLTVNPTLSGDLGTRHRAAVGITEEADCLSIVVSEETGWISTAAFGELRQNLTVEEVDEQVNRHFGVGKFKALRPSFGSSGEPERVREAAPHPRAARQ
jgi:diadenylate cyclase